MDYPVYIIITPARNEADYLDKTIRSVLAQTIPARQWTIVDDGSSDATAEILEKARAKHAFVRVVRRPDRGRRQAGSGVIEAFYAGYSMISEEWDFLVKLDADVSFAPDFFQASFERFVHNPRLGLAGGMICRVVDGRLIEETQGDPSFHVRGACKIYRRNCWNAIGGLEPAVGWDSLDEIKANMLGWNTKTFRDLVVVHHRRSGAVDGAWKNWLKNGQANYSAGYHPLFMLLKCARRFFRKPLGVEAAGLMAGFADGYIRALPRSAPSEVIRYIRNQQINRLMMRPSIWS